MNTSTVHIKSFKRFFSLLASQIMVLLYLDFIIHFSKAAQSTLISNKHFPLL